MTLFYSQHFTRPKEGFKRALGFTQLDGDRFLILFFSFPSVKQMANQKYKGASTTCQEHKDNKSVGNRRIRRTP